MGLAVTGVDVFCGLSYAGIALYTAVADNTLPLDVAVLVGS